MTCRNPRPTRSGLAMAMVALAVILAPRIAAAQSAPHRTEWNALPDPNGLYGGCVPGAGGSGYRSKRGIVVEAGQPSALLQALVVLECRTFDGGGGARVVGCPAGTPYAVCVTNRNDGVGNAILLGVLRRTEATLAQNPACAGGPTRLQLLLRAGEDPRLINGAVTLQCGAASGSAQVRRVPCPPAPHPYGYCLGTGDDGQGHAVTIGVVLANGAADPLGLYGECNVQDSVKRGFLAKISMIPAVEDRRRVTGIELLVCNAPRGFGGALPAAIERRDCADPQVGVQPRLAARYAYCLFGADALGNGIVAGVIAQPAPE